MHVVIEADERALDAYLAAVGRAMPNLPRAERSRILADLRRDTLATAEEVGMTRALADLGDARSLAAEYGGTPRPPVRRRRVVALVAAGALVLAAGVGVQRWLSIGRNPEVTPWASSYDGDYFSEVDLDLALHVARDRTEPTVVGLGLVNDGAATVTIGSSDAPDVAHDEVWFAPATDEPVADFDWALPRDRRSATLAPGENVVMYVELDPCRFQGAGGAVAIPSEVVLQATSLGLTTTQHIAYDLNIGFTGMCGE